MGNSEMDVQIVNEPHYSLLSLLAEKRSALLKAAARITGCRSRAEDVVQDAYLRLTSISLNDLPLKAKTTYVYNVVRNLAIDHYRKQETEQKYFCNEKEGWNVDNGSATTPEAICHNREMLAIIDAALSELPKRTRYAFEMYRIHGKQQKEIAAELGVSPTLVNFMVRDALVHCKTVVANEKQGIKIKK